VLEVSPGIFAIGPEVEIMDSTSAGMSITVSELIVTDPSPFSSQEIKVTPKANVKMKSC
jgi:hypothetical protein